MKNTKECIDCGAVMTKKPNKSYMEFRSGKYCADCRKKKRKSPMNRAY